MTAQILTSELTSIIQESKRKHSELRNAAERSLQDLKALPHTSEVQIAADLQRRPYFINTFLSACKTRNPRLSQHAVNCLQRLIVSRGIANDRIQEVLDAFSECSSVGLEVQLKILQALPPLLQGYADALQGGLLASALQVCSVLQQTKTVAVSNTASATFQQLVSSVFEKVGQEDDTIADDPPIFEIPSVNGPIKVQAAAYDAYRLFEDLCLLMDSQKPRFVRNAQISQLFGLELIATLLTDYSEIFRSHAEQTQTLGERLMPLITRMMSERSHFSVTLRTIRILCIVLRNHLKSLAPHCEIALALLNHMTEPDTTAPWRRALCMEAFRLIFATPDLIVDMYECFDEQKHSKNIVQDSLASFVRLAAEKPSLIGIGEQSTLPVGPTSSKDASQDQVVLQAGGIAGVISGDVGVRESNVSGISSQWSSIKTPCLEQIDKSEAPTIPETYSYSLVLSCVSSLSETLAKTALPLVASTEGNGKPKSPTDDHLANDIDIQTTANEEGSTTTAQRHSVEKSSPLKSTFPPDAIDVRLQPINSKLRTIAALIDGCWPAVLATCSTFLYAALDADYYRSLIRSFQYFTQVAGLLKLATPRDAFLTTLAKSAVPASVFKAEVVPTVFGAIDASQPTKSRAISTNESTGSSAPTPNRSRRDSMDSGKPSLTPRNVMCMRALVNLGIALGPSLNQAWAIILETLQKAELVLAASGTVARARNYSAGIQSSERQENDLAPTQGSLSSEIAAVESAVERLFESTEDYANEAFITLLKSLCRLVDSEELQDDEKQLPSPPSSPSASPLPQQRAISFSGVSITATAQSKYYDFAVAKLGEIARVNLSRFTAYGPEESGWDILINELLSTGASQNLHVPVRSMAVDILGNVTIGVTLDISGEEPDARRPIQRRSMSALQRLIHMLYQPDRVSGSLSSYDLDIHKAALDTLRSLLEQCGETLVDGWDIALRIINSPFWQTSSDPEDEDAEGSVLPQKASRKLVRSAFGSAQLICSDFLTSMSQHSMLALTSILTKFCTQPEDLNISLTTVTLFWNVSDFLQSQLGEFKLPEHVTAPREQSELAKFLAHATEQGSATALWTLLLLRLTTITDDPRPDVRNGAIHTVYRILDNCGEQLPPSLWQHCIQSVLFEIVELNVRRQKRLRASEGNDDTSETKSINGTSKIILDGLSDIFAAYLDELTHIPGFDNIWTTLVQQLREYIKFGSYDLNEIVFTAVHRMLSSIEDEKKLSPAILASSASLWAESVPQASASFKGDNPNGESAFVAYVESIKSIYKLMKFQVNASRTKIILENLSICIKASKPAAYSSDVDRMTNLQVQVLEVYKSLRTDIEGVPSMVIATLSEFLILPYRRPADVPENQRLSYVAFAKAVSEQLEAAVISHVRKREIYRSGSLASAAVSLSEAVNLKYKWTLQGAEPSLWRKASSSAVAIFKNVLPAVVDLELDTETIATIWSPLLQIISGTTQADLSSPPPEDMLLADETFDLASLTSLRGLIVPSLGQNFLPLALRQEYILALFYASLVHTYGHYGQTLIPDLPSDSPFKDLYDLRFGRTLEPPFNPRLRMSYYCLDELFALASNDHDDESASELSSNWSNLAATALPCLILRCVLPLKMYIADQPLRGKMPTPMSQRLELLHILHKLKQLDCKPNAVPTRTPELIQQLGGEGSGLAVGMRVLRSGKRHLEWLLPLVNRARRWARRDDELLSALEGILDVAFGVGDVTKGD